MPNTKDETGSRVKRRARKVREFVSKLFKGKKTVEPTPTSLSLHKPPTEEGKTSKPKRKLTEEEQEELNEQFRDAAKNGKTDDVRRLARLGADVNEKNKEGRTAIHLAAAYGHTETCKVLKELGADINEKDKEGWTAIHLAATYGHTETCRVLLELGANPLLENKEGKTARDLTSNPEIKKLLENWENIWKLVGEEKINELIGVIRECNPDSVREIIAGL